jgi:RNA polymerase sigma factor (sigma-70 family)
MSELDNVLKEFDNLIVIKARKAHITGMDWKDVAQEIRIKIWHNYHMFDNKSSLKTWINKVADNCIINLAIKSKTITQSYLNEADSSDEIAERKSQKE